MKTKIMFRMFASAALFASHSVLAEEIIVPSTYDEEAGCLIGDVVALTNAIHNVQENGVIVLSNGVYDVSFLTNAPSGTYDSNNAGLSLLTSGGKSGVTIRGFTGNPEDVVLDGNGACYRVIALNAANVSLRDLTVRGGNASAKTSNKDNYKNAGGALFANGTGGLISNCIFTACSAQKAGGAAGGWYQTKRGRIMNSLFYGNTCLDNRGGAIANCSEVIGCTIISNKATSTSSSNRGGGGLSDCTTVSNCVVAYNYAYRHGGGVYNCGHVYDSTIEHNVSDQTISGEPCASSGAYLGRYYGCTFRDNCGGSVCGGVYMENCTIEDGRVDCATNVNCVFRNLHDTKDHVWAKGNVQYPDGKSVGTENAFSGIKLMRGCLIENCNWNRDNGAGAVNCSLFYNLDGSVENCTFVNNQYYLFGRDFESSAVFCNCAILGDGALFDKDSVNYCFSNCVWTASRLSSARVEPYVDAKCIELGSNGNPKFVGKGEHPMTPKLTSPLLGAGMVMDWMTDAVDLAGNPRVRDGKVDIGAYQCWLDPVGFSLRLR